ncbi:MAG: radical SAM protein [Candidatus Cloacimonadota bacterium]|nr:radical SAM protein [Candidatus Cloacimonadota bacterium]
MKYKYLFGPVPSRRLGISLGIDLLKFKTCTFDCVYCECGKTTDLTFQRKEFVPTDDVINELDDYLSKNPKLDFLTFSGSGEPTLHIGIGKIIEFLKRKYPQYKVALLTNASLFSDEQVRHEIRNADIVMPSLDAVSPKIFQKINRPHKTIKINDIIGGLKTFREEYSGEIWLEIFLLEGLNSSENELNLIKETVEKIKPTNIQLNSLDRPGTEDWCEPISEDTLKKVTEKFSSLPIEIISKFQRRDEIESFDKNISDRILATIQRRPCTAEDLSQSLGVHINEISKYLQSLLEKKVIEPKHLERGTFFKITR